MQKIRFHLAIPSNNIKESMEFYSKLGIKIGRFTEKTAILDFFGTQVVCHYTRKKEKNETVYPRHYGLILGYEEWDYIYNFCDTANIKIQYSVTRNKEDNTEHDTFFIQDPSFNWIEFKRYKDERVI